MNADAQTYLELENPAERVILDLCARVSDVKTAQMPVGIDGCGIPVYAVPLRNAALSFLRLATLHGLSAEDAAALGIVRDAMMAFPEYVSGTGEFDATLMDAAAGSIACKAGAEGIHGVAALEAGIGIALKVLDGTKRAVAPASSALLDHLQLLTPATLTQLRPFLQPQLTNRAGRMVGEIRAQRAMLE